MPPTTRIETVLSVALRLRRGRRTIWTVARDLGIGSQVLRRLEGSLGSPSAITCDIVAKWLLWTPEQVLAASYVPYPREGDWDSRPRRPSTRQPKRKRIRTVLGGAIRAKRLEEGMSVREAANYVGIAGSTLSRYESGVLKPRPDNAKQLGCWLGWTREAVLEAAESPVTARGPK